jgi:hypothetical protein
MDSFIANLLFFVEKVEVLTAEDDDEYEIEDEDEDEEDDEDEDMMAVEVSLLLNVLSHLHGQKSLQNSLFRGDYILL